MSAVIISTIMNAASFGAAQQTVLPQEIVTAVEVCGFFESIPLWAVTMVWSYIGELVFNMLVLVGAVKMADRVVRE